MANNVFANGREVSCKKADGKSICAFPDVCMTPPENPATPPGVPVPYPNTGMAKDTTSGSKSVKISGKEIMLKNKSYFKKSTGDEAGCAAKKGVITSVNRGKAYFNAWSMDVKFEGENVVRHLDLTTHNHASPPGQTPPWAYTDSMSMAPIEQCKKEVARKNKACEGKNTKAEQCNDKACKNAKKCLLVSKKQADSRAKNSQVACCDGETGHHLVEGHGFTVSGTNNKTNMPDFPDYSYNDAPCVCAECPQDGSGRYEGDHGFLHSIQGKLEVAAIENAPAGKKDRAWTYKKAKAAGIRALQQTFPSSKCSRKCLQAQLDAYHKKQANIKDSDDLRTEKPKLTSNQKELSHELVPETTISTW